MFILVLLSITEHRNLLLFILILGEISFKDKFIEYIRTRPGLALVVILLLIRLRVSYF